MMDSVRLLAEKYYCRTEDMIYYRARNLAEEKEVEKIMQKIRSTAGWAKNVRKKAIKKGIPYEQMLRKDAEYILKEKEKKIK